MNQGLFGTWGLELAPQDFARSVAALGSGVAQLIDWRKAEFTSQLLKLIAEDDQSPINWYGLYLDNDDVSEWMDSASAAKLVEAWTNLSNSIPRPRLELSFVPYPILADLVQTLAAPEVNAGGIYCRKDEPAGEVRWNWPLRVGFLDNREARSLYQALIKVQKAGQDGWRKEYIRLIPPGQLDALGCHLLLLPGGLKKSLSFLSTNSGVVRAACVLVLGEAGELSATGTLMDAVRAMSRAECVAVIDFPLSALSKYERHFQHLKHRTLENFWSAWFIELVRSLSHNRSLDTALFEVWRELGEPRLPPIIVASRRLVRESQISSRLVRLGIQLQEPEVRNVKLDVPKYHDRSGQFLGTEEKRPIQLGELGAALAGNARHFRFDNESDAGSEMLDLLRVYRGVKRELPNRPPRWVQVHVSPSAELSERDPLDGKSIEKSAMVFQPGSTHYVDVFVGPREHGAISPSLSAPPLPEDSLPDDRGVMLTVVLAVAAEERLPQVQNVFLPRSGRSTTCRFAIRVGENAIIVEARIIVLFRNRVLQTSILTGPVVDRGTGEIDAITITPETLIRDTLDDLESRSDFDASIVLNHAGDGTPAITAVHDDIAVRIPLPEGITRPAQWFDDLMEEVADNAADFKDLASNANLGLLRRMAQQGSLLWRNFNYEISNEIDMSRFERLQVVSTSASTRLPIEYFYDLPAPEDNARLCEGAEEALRTGKPCKLCAKRPSQDRTVVCPLGFWGLTRVLERHMPRKGEREKENELRAAGPIGERKVLSVLGTYLFAASNRVDAVQPGGIARVKAALEKTYGSPPQPIATWEDWTRQVSQQASQLLFIVPHVVQGDQPVMEIGADSRLKAALIDERHVRYPMDREPAPVVVLLGCKTGKAKVPFSELPGIFRMQGAAVVLCTGAPIVGRHAVRVAEALLDALAAAASSKKPKSIGDVVRDVRRAMILDGLPMVFTVLAFGDFDWQIAASTRASASAPARKVRALVKT